MAVHAGHMMPGMPAAGMGEAMMSPPKKKAKAKKKVKSKGKKKGKK